MRRESKSFGWFKRVLRGFLAVTLVLGLFPMGSFAIAEEQEGATSQGSSLLSNSTSDGEGSAAEETNAAPNNQQPAAEAQATQQNQATVNSSNAWSETDLQNLKIMVDELPSVDYVQSLPSDSTERSALLSKADEACKLMGSLTEPLSDEEYSLFEEALGESRLEKLAGFMLISSIPITPMSSPDGRNAFITLHGAGNPASFGVEDSTGVFDNYSIGAVCEGLTDGISKKFWIQWGAKFGNIGGSDQGRKIIITVPRGFKILSWSTLILNELDTGAVITTTGVDGSTIYTLNIKDGASVEGELSQSTEVEQDAAIVFEDYEIGKTYDFKIECYTSASPNPIETDYLKLKPKAQEAATWSVATDLNDLQHSFDYIGENGALTSYSVLGAHQTTYATPGSTMIAPEYLPCDYQGFMPLGRYMTSSSNNPVSPQSSGKPASVITDITQNGSWGLLIPYPGMKPAVTLEKTAGYLNKEVSVNIPLPAYADGDTTSLRLYNADGAPGRLISLTSANTAVYFKPDASNNLYRLPAMNQENANGVYRISYDDATETATLVLSSKDYVSKYYYVDANTSYMDLLAQPGKFYITFGITADFTKLATTRFLGSVAAGGIGDNHQIVAGDKVSIQYTDMSGKGRPDERAESIDPLTLNFKGNTPKINYTSYVSKDKNYITEQSFDSVSKSVTEAVALADSCSSNLLASWNHAGGAHGNLDLGRGQTNIHFDYTYEPEFSPRALYNLYNGSATNASDKGSGLRQNSTYQITITDAATGVSRLLTIGDNWKDADGNVKHTVTPADLALTANEYVSHIRVDNPFAMVSGSSFADKTTSSWQVFTAEYQSRREIYENGQPKTLESGHVATVEVSYGSDQIADTTMTEKVTLIDTRNNFTVSTARDYGSLNASYRVAVNEDESLYTLYGFYIRKYKDTKLYDEDAYPTLTLSGKGLELTDIIAFNYNNTLTNNDKWEYWRRAVVPVSYINDKGETVDLSGYDWSEQKYQLGTSASPQQYIENRLDGANATAVGYNFASVFDENNDNYAQSITFELRMNDISVNNSAGFTSLYAWLACSKLAPGYLNYNGVVGTQGKDDIGEDFRDKTAPSYPVDIAVNSPEAFVPKTGNTTLTGFTNHVANAIKKNTFPVVYGLKDDSITVTDYDHELNPVGAAWTGRDGASGSSKRNGQLCIDSNIPYNGASGYTQAQDKQRNIEATLTEVSFDVEYNAQKSTLNLMNAGVKSTEITNLSARGTFDYKRMAYNFAGTDPDALALTTGFALNGVPACTNSFDGIQVEYTTNNDATPRTTTLATRSGTSDAKRTEGYVYFDLRPLIGEGNYLTSLKVLLPENYSELVSNNYRNSVDLTPAGAANTSYRKNMGMPNIRLVRIGPLPKRYPVSGEFVGQKDKAFTYDKLDVACTLEYTDVFDTPFTSAATGKTSRITSQKLVVNKLNTKNTYTSTDSGLTSSTYQGSKTNWTCQLDFTYEDGGSVDPDRRIHPVFYFKVLSDYVPDMTSFKLSFDKSGGPKTLAELGAIADYKEPGLASGDPQYGTLIIDLGNTAGLKKGTAGKAVLTGSFDVKLVAMMGRNIPVPEIWMDVPYDRDSKGNNAANDSYDYLTEIADTAHGGELNSLMYEGEYANGPSSNYPAQLDASGAGAVMLKSTSTIPWNIANNNAAGVSTKAISNYSFERSMDVVGRDVSRAADNDPSHYLFKSESALVTPNNETTNWAVYIPVPKKGNGNDFGMKAVGVDISELEQIGAENIKIFYSNDENFTTNEAYNTGTDTGYTEWTSGNASDLENATCIKVTVDKIPGATRGNIFCSYKLTERKSEIGTQKVFQESVAGYFSGTSHIKPAEDNQEKNKVSYALVDMDINGSTWFEEDYNSLLDDGEAGVEGVEFSVRFKGNPASASLDQKESQTYKTDAQGNFTLKVPREDSYLISVKTPDDKVLVKKFVSTDGAPHKTTNESWFDRDQKETDEVLFVPDNAYTFKGVLVGFSATPTIDFSIPAIHVATEESTLSPIAVTVAPDAAVPSAVSSVDQGVDKVELLDNTGTSFKVKPLKTGVAVVKTVVSDGYGGTVEKTEKAIVYNKVSYDTQVPTIPAPTDTGHYYPSTTDTGADAQTDKFTTAAALTRTGYEFLGWSEDKNATTAQYGAGEEVSLGVRTADVTLYAIWRAYTYTVAFDKNSVSTNGVALDGTPTTPAGTMPNKTMTYDVTAPLNENTYSLVGYDFVGWNRAADGTGESFADKASVVNLTDQDKATVTLYAQWRPHTYNIEFAPSKLNGAGEMVDINGNPLIADSQGNKVTGSTTNQNNIDYGTPTQLSSCGYALEGYTFDGWEDEAGTTYANEEEIKSLTSVEGATIKLSARWQVNSYTVTFVDDPQADDPGKELGTDTVTYTQAATAPGDPDNRTGYTFDRWDKAFDCIIENLRVVAKYIPNTYTVSFDKGSATGGETMADLVCTYDQETPLPQNEFTNPGYYLAGWSTQPNDSTVEFADKELIKNLSDDKNGTVTLYAVWVPCEPARVNVEAVLQIDGDKPTVQESFTFILEGQRADATGAFPPMPSAAGGNPTQEKTIVGPGEIDFGLLTFISPGTYTYLVTQHNDAIEGYTYDSAPVYLVFTVVQNGSILEASLSYKKGGDSADAALFINFYKAPAVSPPPVDPGAEISEMDKQISAGTIKPLSSSGNTSTFMPVTSDPVSSLVWVLAGLASCSAVVLFMTRRYRKA